MNDASINLMDAGSYSSESSIADSDDCGEPERAKSEPNEVIARQETKDVLRLKLLVLLVLVLSAAGIGTTVYIYTSRTEVAQFEHQFRDDTNKLYGAIGSSIDKTLATYDSLAVSTVSFAKATGAEWPFVTIPNFALRMSKILPLSDVISICLAPVVTPANRRKWEAYSLNNDYWVNESLAIQETWEGYYGPPIDSLYGWEPAPAIVDLYDILPYNLSRIYLPLWQNFPIVPVVCCSCSSSATPSFKPTFLTSCFCSPIFLF